MNTYATLIELAERVKVLEEQVAQQKEQLDLFSEQKTAKKSSKKGS